MGALEAALLVAMIARDGIDGGGSAG